MLSRLLLLATLLTSASAADLNCTFLAEANAKIYAIPTHLYMTETASTGKTRNSELIYLNTTTYVQTAGNWTVSPLIPQKMAEMHKASMATHPNATCHTVREEAVNGEPATIYNLHEEKPDRKEDSQLWISKSRGLPLKMEMDVAGKAGTTHRTMRYEYSNVQAPAGVH